MATMPLLQDDTIAFGEEDDISPAKGTLTHPYVTFVHLAFRGAALVTYMLCGWFSDSFIASFVAVVLLLSMDFWTVKNITGRLMVGLRWWNYVDDDGQSHWVFESRKNRVNDRESSIFWTALVLTPALWSLFFIIALFGFKLKWLLLVIIALTLSGANLYGYIKCKVGKSDSIGNVASNFVKQQMFQNALSMMTKQATSSGPQSPPQGTTNIV